MSNDLTGQDPAEEKDKKDDGSTIDVNPGVTEEAVIIEPGDDQKDDGSSTDVNPGVTEEAVIIEPDEDSKDEGPSTDVNPGVTEEAMIFEDDAAEEPTIEDMLEAAEAKAAEYLDGWQRARAEFDNARKRLDRERIEARTNATAMVVGKLLPVIDDFGRAIDNIPDDVAANNWSEGILLVQRKLNGVLETVGIETIPAVGELFDPNVHEAVTSEPSDEFESGYVVRELQAGYRFGKRVIRPTLVIVAQ